MHIIELGAYKSFLISRNGLIFRGAFQKCDVSSFFRGTFQKCGVSSFQGCIQIGPGIIIEERCFHFRESLSRGSTVTDNIVRVTRFPYWIQNHELVSRQVMELQARNKTLEVEISSSNSHTQSLQTELTKSYRDLNSLSEQVTQAQRELNNSTRCVCIYVSIVESWMLLWCSG